MNIIKMLQSQGFGTKKQCQILVHRGYVSINGVLHTDHKADVNTQNLEFVVEGKTFFYTEKLYIALNKPYGYECSHQTSHHPSVFSLLPQQWINRGVQCVGRLDFDTTGLLLLTDDGQWLHQMTHPKHHISKTYHVELDRDISPEQVQALTQTGVELRNEKGVYTFDALNVINPKLVDVSLSQGIYHQVKRMFAASGNHVNALQRTAVGNLSLQNLQLKEGEHCTINIDAI